MTKREADVYQGDYTVYVGTIQPDSRSRALTGQPASFTLVSEQERMIAGGSNR